MHRWKLFAQQRNNASCVLKRQPMVVFRKLSDATTTNSPNPKSPISWNSLFIAGGIGLFAVGYFLNEEEKAKQRAISKNTKTIGKPLLGGDFELVDVKTNKAKKKLKKKNNTNLQSKKLGCYECNSFC